jgi:hypothetical protein
MTLAAAIALGPIAADADEPHDVSVEAAEHHDNQGHDFKNGLALFLGATNEPGHGTEGTIGLEYGRWFSERWAIGGLVDYAGGGQRNLIVAPAVFWKPFGGGFSLLAAAGVEWHHGRGGEVNRHLTSDEPEGDEDETFFVFRIGAAYWFHFGKRYGMSPAVNLDLVDGHEVWVYGLNFEVMF